VLTTEGIREAAHRAADRGYLVYAPVAEGESVFLRRLREGDRIVLDHVLTVNTLKDILLPACERLASYDLDRREVVPAETDQRKILVIGGRPCDAASLAVLDRVFLGDPEDESYARRRARAALFTLGCSRADDACFCTSMGLGPHHSGGSDVLALPRADGFVLRAVSPEGRETLSILGLEADRGGQPDEPPRLSREIETRGIMEALGSCFDSPVWRRVSEACAGCGICSYLCPTCHCYELTDEAGPVRGERLRIWDSCAFDAFTRMAGHQPRTTRHARYRQRIMHKFRYFPEESGRIACVGDGRCIRHCPQGVDLAEVLAEIRRGVEGGR
jgi:ferredoxin